MCSAIEQDWLECSSRVHLFVYSIFMGIWVGRRWSWRVCSRVFWQILRPKTFALLCLGLQFRRQGACFIKTRLEVGKLGSWISGVSGCEVALVPFEAGRYLMMRIRWSLLSLLVFTRWLFNVKLLEWYDRQRNRLWACIAGDARVEDDWEWKASLLRSWHASVWWRLVVVCLSFQSLVGLPRPQILWRILDAPVKWGSRISGSYIYHFHRWRKQQLCESYLWEP